MGYTTEFSGKLSIKPPLPDDVIDVINEFCQERHEDRSYPSIWCDWEVSDDGSSIAWNGSEKSYSMTEWLRYIIARFIPSGTTVSGRLLAQGESRDDTWILEAEGRLVREIPVDLRHKLGIT